MNEHLKLLVNKGLLSFGRERAVYDLLKHITAAGFEEKDGAGIITLRKGGKRLIITVKRRSVIVKGSSGLFDKELEILKKECLNEYALSVRAKKDLLKSISTGRFFRFVLAPVLLEAYNFFQLDVKKFCELLNNKKAVKVFFIFNVKKRIKAKYADKTLNVFFNNSNFSLLLKKSKANPSLLDKNFDVSSYQNNVRDAFFAGLPYTLKALNGEEFDYNFNGEEGGLEQISKAVLEALYEYLMIENV